VEGRGIWGVERAFIGGEPLTKKDLKVRKARKEQLEKAKGRGPIQGKRAESRASYGGGQDRERIKAERKSQNKKKKT